MSIPKPLDPDIPKARRLAREFTPRTPFHHPYLDPNLPTENIPLVPTGLFSGSKLNRELPRPAVTNLHIMLKLRNDPEEHLNEFHAKIPEIDDVLRQFAELKGSSPTMTGEAQLRARSPIAEDPGRTTREGKGTVFNLVSNLDLPGRADVIYLTDAVKDSEEHAEHSRIPSNLRTVEWLNFDGSYAHLEDAEPKMAALTAKQGFDFNEPNMMRESTPSNIRVTEWLGGKQSADLPSETYSSRPGSDAGNSSWDPSREIGPYEAFWTNYNPFGHQ